MAPSAGAVQQLANLIGDRMQNNNRAAEQRSENQRGIVQNAFDPSVQGQGNVQLRGDGGSGGGTAYLEQGFDQAVAAQAEQPSPEGIERVITMLSQIGAIDPELARRKLNQLALANRKVADAIRAVVSPSPTDLAEDTPEAVAVGERAIQPTFSNGMAMSWFHLT